jgi:C-terminal processing protease CtpA/Prc
MPTWALYDSKWEWKAFLHNSFDTIAARKTKDLVIDVRGNEGGLSIGDDILSHMISKDLPAEPVVRRVRYRRVPDDLSPYLDTWDRSFFDWGESAVDSTGDFFRLNRYDNDSGGFVVRPVSPRFSGRVWVLVGASNSSATFEFARAVRQNRLGLLVGRPTGGNLRGINGGAFFFLRLPRTGIELDLPLIGQFAMGDLPDAGVKPDIRVTPTVKDIALGRDAELNAVLSEIHLRERTMNGK